MEKLLLTPGTYDRKILEDLLKPAGFLLRTGESVETGLAQLTEAPALWLVDAGLMLAASPQLQAEVEAACRRHEVFCLLLDQGGQHGAAVQQTVPWAACIDLSGRPAAQLLGRVRDQLTIRRLAYERNLAQGHLLEKQQEYRSNLESAAQIQRSLLPQRLPELANLAFAARFIPSERVGGDLYNALQISEDTVMFYLLDVSGHGISSAMVTVSVYQSLSLQTGQIIKQRCATPPYYRIPSPAEVLSLLDREFPFERFEKFFTISYLLLNIRSGVLRYSSGGHPAPLLVRGDGQVEQLLEGGPIIGVDGLSPFDEGEMLLKDGDRLYLYSDGVTEHMNGSGEQFGVERMGRRLAEQRRRGLEASCDKLLAALEGFGAGGPFRDDVTLFACEYRGRE